MSVIIGYVGKEPQELVLVGGTVHINNQPWPIKNVTQEEIDALAEQLANPPAGDAEGQEAYLNARRIEFLINLLGRAVGDECSDYLEHLIGNLHYRVLEYLGEAEKLGEALEQQAARRRPRPEHGHDHAGCCHGHDHDHADCCHGHDHD